MSHDQDFLHKSEPRPIHSRHRRRRFYRSLAKVFFVLFGVWVFILLLAIGQLVSGGLNAQKAIENAGTFTRELQFSQAQKEVARAERSLTEIEQSLFLFRVAWFLPGLESRFTDMQALLVSGRQLMESFTSLLSLGQDIVQLAGLGENALSAFHDMSGSTKLAILRRLSTSAQDLDLLSARISIATDEFERLRGNALLSPFLGVLEPFLVRLDDVELELAAASIIARLLPELTGLSGERTHLLLFLNNDELRPGGGFIGTYGLLRVQDGEILSLATKDVYALDSVASEWSMAAPVPMQKYNASAIWFFRDANWSPDFAYSAKQAIAMFEGESKLARDHLDVPTSVAVDSVIGFTPTAASSLLRFLGPVEAGGQTFTADNVPELIEYQVEKGFSLHNIPVSQRKEILAELVSNVQSRLVALPFSKWTDVFSLISQSVVSKQIAFYSKNEVSQQTIAQAGWGGVIKELPIDVQMYVDANLASLKSDPQVKRSLHYELFRNESGKWIGRTTMTYKHEGTFDWRTTRYRTYARLFVPKGSTLIRAQGLKEGPDEGEELGLTTFGGFVVVELGQQQDVMFEYTLSDTVVNAIIQQSYELKFLKQMGARDYPLTLQLDFDKNVTNASPAENRNEWGDDTYRLNTKLDQDMNFEIKI